MDELIQKYTTELEPLAQQRFQSMQYSESGVAFQQNQPKNRYGNIIPYLHTQPPGDYFNGNIVKVGDISFFVTQAPVNVNDFYQIMDIVKSTSVIQVTKFAEGGILKAERYVPLVDSEDITITQNAILSDRLSLAIKTQQEGKSIKTIEQCLKTAPEHFSWFKSKLQTTLGQVKVESYLQIKSFYKYDVRVEGVLKFDYFYFPNWSDQSVPDNMKEIYSLCQQIHDQTNITVHCSAGIGRSATFCICFYIFESFENKKVKEGKNSWDKLEINIFDIIEIFRTSRNPLCVQTVEQFKFILEFSKFCDQQ